MTQLVRQETTVALDFHHPVHISEHHVSGRSGDGDILGM